MKSLYISIITGLILICCSCRKFMVAEEPINQQSAKFLYSSDVTAAQVLNGIFYYISQINLPYKISLTHGLLSDEIELFNKSNQELLPFYTNSMTGQSETFIWGHSYDVIFKVNAALEGIESSKGVSQAFKQQFVGEMKFLRAYSYFNLANCYGAVPLITSTDYQLNYLKGRASEAELNEFVMNELAEAKQMVSTNYVGANLTTASTNRTHINKSVVAALQAKVSLYQEEWIDAERYASEVIGNSVYELVQEVDQVFLAGSKEAIWQIAPIDVDWGTSEARNFLLPETGPNIGNKPVYLNRDLANLFESGDLRKQHWIGKIVTTDGEFFYSRKYKQESKLSSEGFQELSIVFRLAEIFLIRAEAKVKLGKEMGPGSAQEDLWEIRRRAGLTGALPTDSHSLLASIAEERRRELFVEMGNRWQDLKRTEKISILMPSVAVHKEGRWQPTDQLFPIPEADLLRAPNLKPQNPGY